MKKKLQVFISSTYEDLKEERQAAVESVLNAGHIPAGMELFNSDDKSQKEIIKRWINESDVYMLILGGRYGSIDEETGLSYTQWEYNYAGEVGKPRFAVVINESALEEKVRIIGSSVIERNNPTLYEVFKGDVLSKVCKFYNDLKDIKITVLESLKESIGAERVGFRISPRDLAYIVLFEGEQTMDFYLYLVAELAKLDLAYLHLVHAGNEPLLQEIRAAWPNALLVNRMGRPLALIDKDIEEGNADVATIGAWALSTPDFVERLKVGAPLNRPDQMTFFGGNEKGYTDYPTMDEQ